MPEPYAALGTGARRPRRYSPCCGACGCSTEVGSELGKTLELAEQLFTLAERAQDPTQLLQARQALAITSLCLGNPSATREHMEQGVALYDPRRHSSHSHLYGLDPGVSCLAFGAVALWLLGYPDQAVQRSREAVARGGELGEPSTACPGSVLCRGAPSLSSRGAGGPGTLPPRPWRRSQPSTHSPSWLGAEWSCRLGPGRTGA